MWKITTIFILGIVSALAPRFLGLRADWTYGIVAFCGVISSIMAYMLRREFLILHHTVLSGKDVVTEMYVESMTKKTAPTPTLDIEEKTN